MGEVRFSLFSSMSCVDVRTSTADLGRLGSLVFFFFGFEASDVLSYYTLNRFQFLV